MTILLISIDWVILNPILLDEPLINIILVYKSNVF